MSPPLIRPPDAMAATRSFSLLANPESQSLVLLHSKPYSSLPRYPTVSRLDGFCGRTHTTALSNDAQLGKTRKVVLRTVV